MWFYFCGIQLIPNRSMMIYEIIQKNKVTSQNKKSAFSNRRHRTSRIKFQILFSLVISFKLIDCMEVVRYLSHFNHDHKCSSLRRKVISEYCQDTLAWSFKCILLFTSAQTHFSLINYKNRILIFTL